MTTPAPAGSRCTPAPDARAPAPRTPRTQPATAHPPHTQPPHAQPPTARPPIARPPVAQRTPAPPSAPPRRAILRALALLAALALPVGPATAQQGPDTARMAADRLIVEADGTLRAEGGVEVLHRNARLRAEALVFTRGTDDTPDRLDITGPIVLQDDTGTVILGDAAQLSPDLRDGVLEGARMVLDRRLQMAATRVERRDGRTTRLERAVASSCQICTETSVPLWEIRAAAITHDAEAQTLTFDRAALRVAGRTVAVVPRLRLPDPTVTRQSGLLAPEFLGTSALGPGVRLPYFIVLDDHSDLTLAPRIHARGSATLQGTYRQALARGGFRIDAAVTRDQLRPDAWRGALEVTGDIALAPGTGLGLRLETFSDPRYRSDYGVSDDDIRTNTIFLDQVRRDRVGRLRYTQFRPFRGDFNAELPNRVLDAGFARRFTPPGLGGTAWLAVDALGAVRSASDPVGGAGRDMGRLSLRADWRRGWITAQGLEVAALGAVQADHIRVRQDERFAPRIDRFAPTAAVELRWPLVRQDAGGAHHLLEPMVQLVWSRRALQAAPDEDSLLAELDEVTLFRLRRGPGFDGAETGARANIGLGWTRIDPAGWRVQALAGRVLRARALPGGPDGPGAGPISGLGGRHSDWLAAVRVDTAGGLWLGARALVTTDGGSPRQELRAGWIGADRQVFAHYIELAPDPVQARPRRTGELGLGGQIALGRHWQARGDVRYDTARGETSNAGLGARYLNECLAVDLSLSRRFVSSTSVAAQTEIALSVELIGFGDRPGGPARRCGP
ncbi:MAG: LPS-assembly protein LptD [Alkalilacustris sp.]